LILLWLTGRAVASKPQLTQKIQIGIAASPGATDIYQTTRSGCDIISKSDSRRVGRFRGVAEV
jgi:hypothetical protein